MGMSGEREIWRSGIRALGFPKIRGTSVRRPYNDYESVGIHIGFHYEAAMFSLPSISR